MKARVAFVALALAVLSCSGAKAPRAHGGGQCLVISEVYGGGGNVGAPLNRDFVELANRCGTPVALDGLALQYGSAAGNFTEAIGLAGTVPPHGFLLIAFGSVGAAGAAIVPDAETTAFGLAASAGKIALVAGATLGAPCVTGASVVDLVGYGGAATCFEGAAPAPPGSNTTSVARGNLCADTDQNAGDLGAGAPSPRNAASGTFGTCTTAVRVNGFSARLQRSGVLVRWRTASEAGLLGFNVLRAQGGRRAHVNRHLIACRSLRGKTRKAHQYVLVDRAGLRDGRLVRYWLQAVHANGRRTLYGPVAVRAGTSGGAKKPARKPLSRGRDK